MMTSKSAGFRGEDDCCAGAKDANTETAAGILGELVARDDARGKEVVANLFLSCFLGGATRLTHRSPLVVTFWRVPSVAAHRN
jgi:hypothetical protein